MHLTRPTRGLAGTALALILSLVLLPAGIASAAGTLAVSLLPGQVVRGTVTLYAGGAPAPQLSVDGRPLASTATDSLPAVLTFEGDGIQSGSQNLQNSLWVNGRLVTQIRQDVNGYATATVAIPAGYLHAGTNTVTVRAGSSLNPTDLTRNHDDFTIRNVQLRLMGGQAVTDPSVPASQVISLGDGYPGGNATEAQVTATFTMTVPTDLAAGVQATLDTTTLADGTHTLTVTSGTQSITRTFVVDNTAPVVTATTPADGETISGPRVRLSVTATDALSAVSSITGTLDGRVLPLPADFPTENIVAGEHTFTYTVRDAAGNSATGTVHFTTTVQPLPDYDRGQVLQGHAKGGKNAPVLVAAGDIACAATSKTTPTACHHAQTAEVGASANPDVVAALADTQYDVATLPAMMASYDKTWGRFNDIVRPLVGNHEYAQAYYPGARADGYFDYFNGVGNADGRAGDREHGYYSYDMGRWHVVVLNSECGVVSCAPGSGQYRWLENDLATHHNKCTMAMWHKPTFSALSADGRGTADTKPLWELVDRYGVDVVLGGHDHNYQRWAPQDVDGNAKADGPRLFVVGTGGVGFHPNVFPTAPNLDVVNKDTFGVLKMTLRPTGYSWEFLRDPSSVGTLSDSGSATCR